MRETEERIILLLEERPLPTEAAAAVVAELLEIPLTAMAAPVARVS